MSELATSQPKINPVEELPVEKVDFVPVEVIHFETAPPQIDVEGSERLGVMSGDHSKHIQAVGGFDIEAEATKVLPPGIGQDILIKPGDADKSGSWLNVLRGRIEKLKGAA